MGGCIVRKVEPEACPPPSKKAKRKKSWGPQVPVGSPLEAALLRAEQRVCKIDTNSLESKVMRRWSLTHQKEYENEKKLKKAGLSGIARRISSSGGNIARRVSAHLFSESSTDDS